MPATKKPRKKYRPRPVLDNPVGYVLEGFSILPQEDVLKTSACNHAALTDIVQGRGGPDQWGTLRGALNMASVLDEQVYACQFHANMLEALEAHWRCWERYVRTGKMGYSGPDLTAINLALEVHDVQLQQATHAEVAAARNEVLRLRNMPHRYINNIRKGGPSDHPQHVGKPAMPTHQGASGGDS